MQVTRNVQLQKSTYPLESSQLERTSFGEVAVGEIEAEVAWNFQYNVNSDIIASTVTGSGTVTQANAMAILSTTANVTSSAKIDTKKSLRYVPGISGIVRFTAIFTTGVAGSTQIIGLGNGVDGLFFGFDGDTFGVLIRNNTVDTWIPKSSWSEWTFDDFDHTKGNVFQITYQWLGYGEIKFAIEDPNTGIYRTVHRYKYANTATVPSMTSPSIPLMAYVANTTNNTDIVLKTPSGMAGRHGRISREILAVNRAVDNTVSGVSTETPVVSIQNPVTYQSKTNRQKIQIVGVGLAAEGSKPGIIRLYRGMTLPSAAFADVNSSVTPLQVDKTSLTSSGGDYIEGWSVAKASSNNVDITTLDIQLSPGETATVTATSAAATDFTIVVNTKTLF